GRPAACQKLCISERMAFHSTGKPKPLYVDLWGFADRAPFSSFSLLHPFSRPVLSSPFGFILDRPRGLNGLGGLPPIQTLNHRQASYLCECECVGICQPNP